jgi:hypothetical protein
LDLPIAPALIGGTNLSEEILTRFTRPGNGARRGDIWSALHEFATGMSVLGA